jgi:uncharacterized protein (TIGR03435 family)
MMPADLPAVANHLWQSTLCACVVWVLSLALTKNRAAVRYRLWLAASMKFLVPFSLFVSIGAHLGWRTVDAAGRLPWPMVVDSISRPFAVSAPVPHHTTSTAVDLIPALLCGIWFCGFAASALFWARCWSRARAVRQRATPLALNLPIPAMSCSSTVEPGVFGIRHPVLLLPEGIADRLPPAQLDAIVAHELCHVRRRDNLTGAVHLIVEAIFWFHPLVWWIRARLLEERERACDEAVLQSGREPGTYAEGILNVSKFYLESELVCVSGITGSDLRKRIERIASCRVGSNLGWGRRLLLAVVGFAGAGVPVAIGLYHAQPTYAHPQPQAPLSFEVASVKPNNSGEMRSPSLILPGGRFTATNNTVRALILNAYGISFSPNLLEGGPGWIDSARYDIEAKAGANVIQAGTSNRVLWEKTRLMLQALLADRFKLAIHRQTKEMAIYELVAARNGPKLQKSEQEKDCDASSACHGFSGNPTRLSGIGVDMYDLALILSSFSDRPVVDHTGIQGLFDIKLQWNPFAAGSPPEDDAPRSPAAEAREGRRPDLSTLPTVFGALEQQLGLKLESHKGPVEIYVIDRVERPSGN